MNLTPVRRMQLVDPVRLFEREMEQVMQRFLGAAPEGPGQDGGPVWSPRIDIEEDQNQYVIKADLPGVDPKDVEISVVENTLIIRGQKREEREEKKKDYHRIERFEGQFYREIVLPNRVDPERIQARSSHGVLTITIPKKPEARPRKIEVQAEPSQGTAASQASGSAEGSAAAQTPASAQGSTSAQGPAATKGQAEKAATAR